MIPYKQLFTVLASKLGMPCRSDEELMAAYNKLCLSCENDQIIKQNEAGHRSTVDEYNKKIQKLQREMGVLKSFAMLMLVYDALDDKSKQRAIEVASGLGIEIKTRNGNPYLDIKLAPT